MGAQRTLSCNLHCIGRRLRIVRPLGQRHDRESQSNDVTGAVRSFSILLQYMAINIYVYAAYNYIVCVYDDFPVFYYCLHYIYIHIHSHLSIHTYVLLWIFSCLF